MNLSYLALGSNLNTPERHLRQAIVSLRNTPSIHLISQSSIYLSYPLGQSWQPYYCNMVVAIKTSLPPLMLLQQCKSIEKKHGRIRKVRWGSRTLDIDILLFNNYCITHNQLIIPHPEMTKRDFVLKPLLEIAPNITLPSGSSDTYANKGFESNSYSIKLM